MRRVCFFHGGCPDGFGAAWAVWKLWGEAAEYRAHGHDDSLDASELTGAQVVFVDIAPPNDCLRALGEHATQVVVLDHHVTAQERYAADPGVENSLSGQGHVVHFDLEHSGAMLAWRHFHPERSPPELLRYVEDMDLWRWALPNSAEVNAALNAYPRRFDVWEWLASRPIEQLAREGESIVRNQRMEVERALQNTHTIALGSERVEAVNALFNRSLIGHELAKRAAYGLPCGVVYRLQGLRVDASIYSVGDFDVAKIASQYGGGGHRNAAGFSVPLSLWLERFV